MQKPRRHFYLIDRENDNWVNQIPMKAIVDHFIGDGTGPVRWNDKNVDLNRFAEEMDEIGYHFVITYGSVAKLNRLIRRFNNLLADYFPVCEDLQRPQDPETLKVLKATDVKLKKQIKSAWLKVSEEFKTAKKKGTGYA